ncbi:MAG TPA: flagellar hook capping FlgD N-terminal domain-containing protein [Rhodanobacter sp.]|nr:flagellar hook capping FlgD N-terminal domain-containing protein [Rhodanobacter sp.]
MTINTNNVATNTPTTPVTAAAPTALSNGMTQSDFLKLLTAQLQAQDPTNPVDNSQFVSQMAQFSQLSATQDLLSSVNSLGSTVGGALQTSQTVGASSMLNHEVLVPSTSVSYLGTPATGAVNVASAGNVTVTIADATGKVVRTLNLGNQDSGLSQFSWDGNDDSGNPLAQGVYSMAATSGTGAAGTGAALDTYVAGKVTAVGYGGSTVGTYLQVAGVGGVALSQVAQIL